jgi:hypothetical protein
MIDRDLTTRDPTWEELTNALQCLSYTLIRIEDITIAIKMKRIDEALQDNATAQAVARDNKRTARNAQQVLDAMKECDRLDEERVSLHTMRKLVEDGDL